MTLPLKLTLTLVLADPDYSQTLDLDRNGCAVRCALGQKTDAVETKCKHNSAVPS